MRPAEASEAASKGARDAGREECLDVVQAAGDRRAVSGFVKCEQVLPALTWSAGVRIVEQISLGREAEEDRHDDALVPGLGALFVRCRIACG